MIKRDELFNKISRDSDFINSPKHENSLKLFLEQYPDGAPDAAICKALCITQKELDELYANAILKLREGMVSNGRS